MIDGEELSPARRMLILVTVMAATLVQVLDTTIANVALPHMQGALGATPESVLWILTSYIIMAAIATPISGWVETRFGRRNVLAISIAGFTLSSALCGLASSLPMMVGARALQGVFGAFLSPLGQATLLDSFPKKDHPRVMMIWGMGVMVGPILGPILGGWLTDNYGWRWVFFINVPIGIPATVGIWLALKNVALPRRPFDLVGFALLGLFLASFQLMLDRGPLVDWFGSTEVLVEGGLMVGALWMFVVHMLTSKSPVVPVALFRDGNFVIAILFTMLVTGVSMAGSALVAPMLQSLMGYNAMGAGILMMPRGVGVFLAMPLATFANGRVDPRVLVASGIAMIAGSLWLMSAFDLAMSGRPLLLAGIVQGLGIGLAFLPLNIMAFATLAPALRTEAASFYSLARSVGGSISISAMSAVLSRNVQVSHSDLAARMTLPVVPAPANAMIGQLGSTLGGVLRLADAEINRQALMIAYIDDFWLMKWVSLAALPLVLFLRKAKPAPGEPIVHME